MNVVMGPPVAMRNGGDGGGSSNEEPDEEISFDSLFQSFSNQWLHTHLTHHVSLAASNQFWQLAFKFVSNIEDLKHQENNSRKIPQFLQVRKNIYTDNCPKVTMTFAYLNKNDQSIIHVNVDQTPINDFDRNPQFQKLYEEAHVDVRIF